MLATKEKSHPGFQLPTAALHPGFGFAISNTATEFDAALYDFGSGPRSSGYFRDAETGLDYAKARYHQPGMGRFLSADPYVATGGPANPASWNKYSYTMGDPINGRDPRGLYTEYDGADTTDYGEDGSGCFYSKSVDYQDSGCDGPTGSTSCGVNQFTDSNGNCVPLMSGAIVMAPPPPPCPLAGIFGDFTADPNSPTPVHTIFNPTVAGILDVVIAQLNLEGIDPIIEDGFRTESEQADRRKRYPNTAAQGLSWHEIGDAIDFKRNSNLAAINAIMLAAGFTAVAGDPGHYQMKIGVLSQSTADACTLAHPNGN